MLININNKFLKKCTSFFIAVFLLISLAFSEHASALNSYNGQGKPTVFLGYRITDDHTIKLYVDKPSMSSGIEQFKIFQGLNDSGREITIKGFSSSTGQNITADIKGKMPTGGLFQLTTENGTFQPGEVYTVVLNNNISGTYPLGWYTSCKDSIFSFTVPTTFGDPNSGGIYSTSAPALLSTWPENGATNVAVENGIRITSSMPIENWSDVQSGLVLKKGNGDTVRYDNYLYTGIDTITNTSADIYGPAVTDDHNGFVLLQTTGGMSGPCYNFDPDTQYTLSIPDIKLINGKVIPAHTISFHTAGSTVSNPFKQQSTPPITATNNNEDLIIDWSNYAPSSAPIASRTGTLPSSQYLSPPPSGYNIYASTDKYWNFVKINKTPVTDTSFNTFNSGLKPNTTYYFRLTTLSDTNIFNGTKSQPIESGFSPLFLQATTPNDIAAPQWSSGSKINVSDVTVNSLTLNWDVAVDSYGLSAYRIYQNDTLIASVNGDTTTYNVAGLEQNKEYIFKIEAVDNSNNLSTDGPSVNVKLTDTTPPAWPGESTVSVSDINKGSLNLNWSAAKDDIGVTAYKIYQNNLLIGTVSEDINSFTVTGLETDTQYTFKIEAGDGVGNWSTNGPSVTAKTLGNYIPIETRVLIKSPDNSIGIGTVPVTEAITAVVYDQYNNEISGKTIKWYLVEKPIGVSIGSDGVLTVQPFAEPGTITVKCVVDGTEVSSTKQFQIEESISQTTLNYEEVINAISSSADLAAVLLPASSNSVVAISSQSLEAIKAANKPIILTNVEKMSLQLKLEDMNLGGSALNDIKELHIGIVKLDTENSFKLNTDSTKDQLSGGRFIFATLPFKLSAAAILNNNNQLQVTDFINPITVTVPAPFGLSLLSNQQLRACRYNTITGKWEDKGSAVLKDGYITFNTSSLGYWTVMIQTTTDNSSYTNTGNTTSADDTANNENVDTANNENVDTANNENVDTENNENVDTAGSSNTSTESNPSSSTDALTSTEAGNTNTEVKASESSTTETSSSVESGGSNTQTDTDTKVKASESSTTETNSSVESGGSNTQTDTDTKVKASESITTETNSLAESGDSNNQINTENKEPSANTNSNKAVEQKRSLFGKYNLTIGLLLTLIGCFSIRIIYILYKRKAGQ